MAKRGRPKKRGAKVHTPTRARELRRASHARRAQQQALFLREFAQCGTVTRSCAAAKLGRRTVYVWLEEDPRFRELYADALEEAVDALEAEARRRAVEGVLEPVYQGGEKVGSIRKYSDGLLMMVLKGRRKDIFSDRYEHTGKDGKPLVPSNVVLRYYPESMKPAEQPAEVPPPSDDPAV